MIKKHTPPAFARRLLRWFCKPWYVEVIEGDLLEIFDRQVSEVPTRARLQFFINVIRFMRWRYIKDFEDFQPQSSIAMLKTYLKVSFRSMSRHKVQALFNVFGLSLGIACCILIIMHVRYQYSFDKHIPELESIYRVVINGSGPYTPARLVKQMKADYPEVVAGTRVNGMFDLVIEHNDRYLRIDQCMIADSSFFDVFPAEFIRGNARDALNDPTDVVLTERMANELFPDEEAMGKMIASEGDKYYVSAIVSDPPKTSTIPYRAIVAIPREFWATTGYWTGNNFYSYLKLDPQADPKVLEAKFLEFVERYVAPELLKLNTQYTTFQDYLADGKRHFFGLVPMKDIHLHHPRLTMNDPGDYANLMIFMAIAVFILLIACINYINMATARSSLRAKEIGMRKVMGSVQSLIRQQFLIESFMVSGIAVVVGIFLALLILPYFNAVSQSDYYTSDVINGTNMIMFTLIFALAGLLSGLYPATYMASFKPISALRGEAVQGGNRKMRAALVVFQFAISLLLMVATFIVYQQLSLMSNRKLGIDAEQVYIINDGQMVVDRFETFEQALKSKPHVTEVGMSNTYPSGLMADWNYKTVGEDPKVIAPYNIFVSPVLDDVWGLKLQKGRFFDPELRSDSTKVVVNEEFVKHVGWLDPIGMVVSRGKGENFTVIGVVENFVTGSAKRGSYPTIFRTADNQRMYGAQYISVKISGNVLQSLDHIEAIWDDFNHGYPIDGVFMDDSFQKLYAGERRFGKLFSGFSILAIVIACMGLFTLSSFILERRKKEIALRKVLGAKVSQIFYNVSSYFFKLIVISGIIALPLTYYLGEAWLTNYVERIHLGAVVFVMPLVLLMCIALLTISYQTIKSARNNPSEALKEE